MSKITFWYHSNATKGDRCAMLYSNWPFNSYPAVPTLLFTLKLCYQLLGILQWVTKSRKAHISSHDGLRNFLTSTFLTISPRVSKSGDRVTEICSSLTKFYFMFYFLIAVHSPHKHLQETFISLECFFDIDFDCTGYPITNTTSIHWFS